MKSYSKYKESGLDWIGKYPNHWTLCSLGYKSNMIVPMRDKPQEFDGDIPWIRIEDFNGKYISGSKSDQKVSETTVAEMNLKVFPVGTVLCSCSCNMGATAIVSQPLISNQTFIGIVPAKDLHSDYLYYLVQAAKPTLDSLGTGAIQKYLSRNDFEHFKVAFPPLPEQQAIADFLDRKTAQIDTLIEKKQRQIELLQEQRTALINHAVTKGLNPDAKMKDSGVEWLGEIPSHWNVSKIKYLCHVSDGNHGEEYPEPTDFTDEENGVPFIRVTEFVGWNITKQGILYITKEKNESMRKGGLQENDILFVNRGSIGKVALVSKEFEGANLNSQIAYFRVQSPNLHYKYLLYFLVTGSFQNMISSLIHGGALVQLPLKRIVGLEVVCPSTEEQSKIINYLDSKTNQIDETITRYSSEIALLQEYRTALISEAVIGKIDVRE